MKPLIVAVFFLSASACTRDTPASAPPAPEAETESPSETAAPTPAPEGAAMKPATCTTLAACKKHEDQVVTVVGTYRKFEIGAGKGRSWHGAVQIDLGGDGPVLGRYWHPESKRNSAEVQQYEGKRVAVTGRFRAETPPNPDDPAHAARLSVPALLDVTSIELATGDETGDSDDDDDERLDPGELPPL